MGRKGDTSEREVEAALVRRVESLGGKCWKFSSPGRVGVPDRICLAKGGRIAFVEVKKPGGKLRAIQVKRKNELEAMGFRVYVLDTIERINEITDEIVGGTGDEIHSA